MRGSPRATTISIVRSVLPPSSTRISKSKFWLFGMTVLSARSIYRSSLRVGMMMVTKGCVMAASSGRKFRWRRLGALDGKPGNQAGKNGFRKSLDIMRGEKICGRAPIHVVIRLAVDKALNAGGEVAGIFSIDRQAKTMLADQPPDQSVILGQDRLGGGRRP